MTDLADRGSDPATGSDGDASCAGGRDLAVLLQSSAAGDEQAFADLYDSTSRLCFGLALRICGDEAAAERVTRDAYLHLWTHSVRYDPAEGSPLSWIIRLVHRRAVACVRHDTARPGNGAGPGWYDAGSAPAPDSPREAVELAYFGGRTCGEVASEEHITPAAAALRIREGLLALGP